MKKFYEGFCKVEQFLCNVGFMLMVALVFISSLARGVGRPLAWSIDVAQLMLCWTTLIGADVAFRHKRFQGLDLLTRRFPIKQQRVIGIAMDLIIMAALVIFIIYGVRLSIDSHLRTFQTLKMSYSWVTIALPVMSVCMLVSVALDIVEQIKHFTTPIEQSKEVDGTI